jgi:hypothetical protein
MDRHTRDIAAAIRSDDGFGIPIVIMSAAIIFLLITMVLTLAVYQSTATTVQTNRVRSMHMADAGISAYLYHLRRDPTYYVANPTLVSPASTTGSWSVLASVPVAGGPVTLRSTGALPNREGTRTVIAEVGFPTFAQYMFFSNADLLIGSEAIIYGKIRSNGLVNNAGRVTGRVYYSTTYSGSGTAEVGTEKVAVKDFGTVSTDLSAMRAVAVGTSTQYSATTFGTSYTKGYKVVFSGTSATIYGVTATTDNVPSGLSSALRTVTIPTSGIMYFDTDVYVGGTYAAAVTVGCNSTIYVIDNLVPNSMSSRNTMGLVAKNNVHVPSGSTATPTDMTIVAAMLGQNGEVGATYVTNRFRNSLTVVGSIAKYAASGFVMVSGTTQICGFRSRTYTYDTRLDVDAPPMYPQMRDGSLKVKTWVER